MLQRIRALLLAGRRQGLSTSNPIKNPHCAEFEVDVWAISQFVLAKLVPVVGVHPFPLNELMLMTAAICRLMPAQVFEWGTHMGKSARIFHECSAHYGIGLQVHSVDLPDEVHHVEHPHGVRGRFVRGLRNVHMHQGDGLDTALSLWKSSERERAPLFFIDGDHSYESVLREFSAIAAEIPDASILLHDTFNQSLASGYNVGP